MSTSILARLAPRYDHIVERIYRAGSGLEPWLAPLAELADIFDAWAVQLLGVNKRTGVMSFSFEGGSAPAAAPVEYLRYYHRIDPRLAKHLPAPVGSWIACEEHFDDHFVETHPFYQDYLLPMGGRYLYGTKLHDDANATVLIGHVSKGQNPPLASQEKEAFARLASHFAKALDIKRALESKSDPHSVGAELLAKMRQPMMLIDNQRRITYRNKSAAAFLARRDPVYEAEGVLACRDSDSDLALTISLRELGLVPISTHGDPVSPQDRRAVRLKRRDGKNVTGTLLALRPEDIMGSFGRIPQALFTLFEPGALLDIEPYTLSMTFDLTPAEARLAAMLVGGRTTEECARELRIKMSTLRTQLSAIYQKTGVSGQADLVRLVMSASAI